MEAPDVPAKGPTSEIRLGFTLLTWRRERDGDGCVALEVGISAGIAAMQWVDGMEGWGAAIVIAANDSNDADLAGRIDALKLARLDVLLIDAGRRTNNVIAGAVETIRRARPYLLIAAAVNDLTQETKRQLVGLGYSRWGHALDHLVMLPTDDPNWNRLKILPG